MLDFKEPNIEIAEISEDKRYGRFVVEPSGKRIWYNSWVILLEELCFHHCRVQPLVIFELTALVHEFAAIPGVKEDVTEIIMNIKSLAIKNNSETNEVKDSLYRGLRRGRGQQRQIFRWIQDIEIMNPDQVIATLEWWF